ncbi:MAG TPA: hypothetical protein VEZ46_08525 [Mycobacteriales bacterium]|jgi:hypothetical protein|nr:hypothetical protein [Mycobacteriales bacterium]
MSDATATDPPAEISNEPCGLPVNIPGVFSPVTRDTGHVCQRAAGHAGVHRWSAQWTGVSPREVEAELQRDYEKWDKPEDE